MSDKTEKRKDPRIKVNWPTRIVTDNEIFLCETINISIAGVLISTKMPLRIEKPYTVTIQPPNAREIQFECNVVWSDLYGIDSENQVYGMGHCFIEVSEEDRHLLENIISSYLKKS